MRNYCEVDRLASNYDSALVHNKDYPALCGSSVQEHQRYLDKHLVKVNKWQLFQSKFNSGAHRVKSNLRGGPKSADGSIASAGRPLHRSNKVGSDYLTLII